jgi:hypothetical protein
VQSNKEQEQQPVLLDCTIDEENDIASGVFAIMSSRYVGENHFSTDVKWSRAIEIGLPVT